MSHVPAVKNATAAWRARRKVLTEAILAMYLSTTPINQLDSAFNCFHPQVVFQDPLVNVKGRDQYEAQFRTLRALFASFKPLTVEITGDVDKIAMDMTVSQHARQRGESEKAFTDLCLLRCGCAGEVEW
jgi:hypothetical protein